MGGISRLVALYVVVEVDWGCVCCYGVVCQYMSSIDECICERFLIMVVWGLNPGSLIEHHYDVCRSACFCI